MDRKRKEDRVVIQTRVAVGRSTTSRKDNRQPLFTDTRGGRAATRQNNGIPLPEKRSNQLRATPSGNIAGTPKVNLCFTLLCVPEFPNFWLQPSHPLRFSGNCYGCTQIRQGS